MAANTKPSAKAAAASLGQMTPANMAAALGLMVVALLTLYYLLLYSPLDGDLQREVTRRRTVTQALERVRTEERQYNDDVAQLERSRTHARDLQRILPDNADIPGFMRSINTLAESSGLQITLIEPVEEHLEQYFVRVPVHLQVTGTYLALARFFRSVSQLPRVINMENIALDNPSQTNGEVRLHASVLATTFRTLSSTEAAAQRSGAAHPSTTATTSGGRR